MHQEASRPNTHIIFDQMEAVATRRCNLGKWAVSTSTSRTDKALRSNLLRRHDLLHTPVLSSSNPFLLHTSTYSTYHSHHTWHTCNSLLLVITLVTHAGHFFHINNPHVSLLGYPWNIEHCVLEVSTLEVDSYQRAFAFLCPISVIVWRRFIASGIRANLGPIFGDI